MKVCKRNKINFKNAIKSAAVFAAVGLLSACGDDSGSSGPSDNPVSETDLVADTFDDLPVCSDKREGVTAYVKDEKVAYVCEDGVWIEDDDTNKDSESAEGSSSSGKSKSSSSGNKDAEPESSTEGKKNLSSSSFEYKQDSSAFKQPDVVSIKDKSISGVTQKGPFVTGSTVKLYELDGKTYKQTGKSFTGKISSDDGKFSVPSVTLASQYALLEANGYFRNEVTGEKSRGTITLNALTDLSDREKVNINLLTHLEYERVMYLVSTGINVPAAKKQAEAEIFNAFGIQGEFANSEDLDIFSKGEGNAALLAISVLMLGRYDEKLSAAELTERLTKFATDIEKDGIWDDEESKAEIADWAAVSFNSEYIRVNIEEWKLGTVPDFEKYVQNYWYTVYDLGDCGSQNKGEVAPIKNKFSKYSKENEDYYGERQYICRNGAWKWASPLDIDSYKANIPANPKEGDFWTGPKTGIVYTYDEGNGGWVIASSEQAELNLGGCTRNRSGEVAKNSDGVYYICRTGPCRSLIRG